MYLRFVLCLPLLFSLVLFAQEDRASISGSVSDSSGGAVPNAKVVVTSVERNAISEAVTTETGRFAVNFLIPGTYILTVEHPGFKKHIQQNIVLATGEKLGLDVAMEVGQLSDSVTVTERVGLLETESSCRGQVITTKELQEIPNQGRNVLRTGCLSADRLVEITCDKSWSHRLDGKRLIRKSARFKVFGRHRSIALR
jgi:hypothetical protein